MSPETDGTCWDRRVAEEGGALRRPGPGAGSLPSCHCQKTAFYVHEMVHPGAGPVRTRRRACARDRAVTRGPAPWFDIGGNVMAPSDRSRSLLATVIGWVLAAIVVWLALRFLLGALDFLIRGVILIVVVVGLLWAYLTLKAPGDS